MKTPILLLLVLLSFTACQKVANITPQSGPVKSKGNGTQTNNPDTVPTIKKDSLPDYAAFRLKLYKDDSNYDETLVMFKKAFSLNYHMGEDAAYMAGFGELSLASISNDGKLLSIDGLPYTQGMSIGLDVEAKDNGAYSFQISYENKMPANVQVWIKDTYLKDSVNVCNANYNFTVAKTDTNSFGSKRFKLIIK